MQSLCKCRSGFVAFCFLIPFHASVGQTEAKCVTCCPMYSSYFTVHQSVVYTIEQEVKKGSSVASYFLLVILCCATSSFIDFIWTLFERKRLIRFATSNFVVGSLLPPFYQLKILGFDRCRTYVLLPILSVDSIAKLFVPISTNSNSIFR